MPTLASMVAPTLGIVVCLLSACADAGGRQATDPVSPGDGALAVRMNNGHYFLSQLAGVIGVGEYDSRGNFVAVHGRKGSGPGEFEMAPAGIARTADDSIVVHDLALRRFSVLGADGSFGRSISYAGRASDFARLPDGSILFSGDIAGADPSEPGPAVHVLSPEGRILRSFGDSIGPSRPDRQLSRSRALARSESGIVGIAKRLEYAITMVLPDGSRRVLVRRAPWFVPSDTFAVTGPQITKLWIDREDRLWVSILTRDPGAAIADVFSQDPSVALATVRFIMEVFQLPSLEFLARERFDGPIFVASRLATAPVADTLGYIMLRVFEPTITGSGR